MNKITVSIVEVYRRHWLICSIYLAIAVVLAGLSLISLWITMGLTNSLVSFLGDRSSVTSYYPVVFFISMQLIYEIVQYTLQRISNTYLGRQLGTYVMMFGMELLFKRIWQINPDDLENNESLSKLSGLQDGVRKFLFSVSTSIFSIIQGIVTIALYTTVLAKVNLIIFLMVFVIAVPSVLKDIWFAKQDLSLINQTSPERRMGFQLLFFMSSKNTLREGYVHNVRSLLLSKWLNNTRKLLSRELSLASKQIKVSVAAELASLLLATGGIIAVILESNRLQLTVGAELAIIQAMSNLQVQLSTIMTSITEIYAGVLTIGAVNRITTEHDTFIADTRGTASKYLIRVHNLGYRYPTRSTNSLQNISCIIPSKTTTVIVGPNGGGKSTFVKCLLGLLSPTEGVLELPSPDRLSSVFQEYVIYPLPIWQNISLSEEYNDKVSRRIGNLVKEFGLDAAVGRLPLGINTVLDTSVSGGGSLSQGELQKIAICRALYSEPDVLFLDEPTSSIDAESEHRIFKSIMRVMNGKTIICVSHRLRICPRADKIIVMNRGKIDAEGTHEQLLSSSNLYRSLYEGDLMLT